MASAPTLVAQTDKLTIMSGGSTDLQSEKLDLDFRKEARRGLGISAASVVNPLVGIGGTLTNPTLNVNIGSALVSGGAAFCAGGFHCSPGQRSMPRYDHPIPLATRLRRPRNALRRQRTKNKGLLLVPYPTSYYHPDPIAGRIIGFAAGLDA